MLCRQPVGSGLELSCDGSRVLKAGDSGQGGRWPWTGQRLQPRWEEGAPQLAWLWTPWGTLGSRPPWSGHLRAP